MHRPRVCCQANCALLLSPSLEGTAESLISPPPLLAPPLCRTYWLQVPGDTPASAPGPRAAATASPLPQTPAPGHAHTPEPPVLLGSSVPGPGLSGEGGLLQDVLLMEGGEMEAAAVPADLSGAGEEGPLPPAKSLAAALAPPAVTAVTAGAVAAKEGSAHGSRTDSSCSSGKRARLGLGPKLQALLPWAKKADGPAVTSGTGSTPGQTQPSVVSAPQLLPDEPATVSSQQHSSQRTSRATPGGPPTTGSIAITLLDDGGTGSTGGTPAAVTGLTSPSPPPARAGSGSHKLWASLGIGRGSASGYSHASGSNSQSRPVRPGSHSQPQAGSSSQAGCRISGELGGSNRSPSLLDLAVAGGTNTAYSVATSTASQEGHALLPPPPFAVGRPTASTGGGIGSFGSGLFSSTGSTGAPTAGSAAPRAKRNSVDLRLFQPGGGSAALATAVTASLVVPDGQGRSGTSQRPLSGV